MRERLVPAERSISAVLTDIVCNIQEIVRSEIRLAESEVRGQLRAVRDSGSLILTGVVAGAFSAFFLLLAAFIILSRVMAAWTAAVCIAVPLAGVALGCFRMGTRRFGKALPAPAAGAKENVQ